MRFAVVSYHLPEAEGTAAGQALLALGAGLVADGHDVSVCSWRPDPPAGDLPVWCEWQPLPIPSGTIARRLRELRRPRYRAAALRGWAPDDVVAVADDYQSFPAVEGNARSVMTLHYSSRIDARALRQRPTVMEVQQRRAERHALRGAGLALTYSTRAAADLRSPARYVPIAYPVPDQAVPVVEEPVAGLLADWAWRPNRVALDGLLAIWPAVRSRVPAAQLLLAGRGLDGMAGADGVQYLGPVARRADFLAEIAVVAFPCPTTSGPKVKVLEALAHGVPVVTTPAGAEGLFVGPEDGPVVAELEQFADALAELLLDPTRRADLAARSRTAVIEGHGPRAAARARVTTAREAFGET